METLFEEFPSSMNNLRFDLSDDNHERLLKVKHDMDNQFGKEPSSSSSTSSSSSSTSSSSSSSSSPKDNADVPPNTIFKFISEMLMDEEDDLEAMPCMLRDCLAFQATEKSFYDAIGQTYPHSQTLAISTKHHRDTDRDHNPAHYKHSAIYSTDYSEPPELFDQVLFCQNSCQHESSSPTRTHRKKKPNKNRPKQVVDLWSLLTQCAQAVASYDHATATQLLAQLRQHSSQHGDDSQRLAHYFANGLEARFSPETPLYNPFGSNSASAADILKAYQVYITACPFQRMSNFYANRSIFKLADQATTIHIIDFGILYGYQWPCLIQRLSERPGGPPRIKITGIEFPQPGFRPSERVDQTGRRLENYCRRFNVPFECNMIADKWENVRYEDLSIDRSEVTVVNCLYRMKNLPDETVIEEDCPRDKVLRLIRKINPDLFIHGVVNGTHSAPFFQTRFREALFHFSALFDMFEASLGREDPHRLMFEREVFGRDVMNVLACEGMQRVERPETYKQWQVRNTRAGFRQVRLDVELTSQIKGMVRSNYHRDFIVDEDGKWLLQGWKGRIFHAISYWRSASLLP